MVKQDFRKRIYDIIFEANNLDDKVFDTVLLADIILDVAMLLDRLERKPALNNSRPV